jgi:hypothetical protein
MIANRAMFVAVLLAGNVLAAEPKPAATLDDFAFGYTLNTPSGSSVYQAALPEELYRLSRRDDLGDMRVFNAQTEIVPYALMRPPVTHEAAKRVTLPVFPVHGGDRLSYESLSIRVVRDQRGIIVNINNKLPMEKRQPVTAYMIDASQVDAPLAKLYVRWGKTDGFVAKVSLSLSDDLNRWSAVVNSTVLADLAHGSERLTRDVIEFRPVKAKYFQLTWPPEAQGSSIVAIEAELAPTQQEPAAAWLKLEGQRVKGDDGRELFGFDTGGHFPIDRLNLGLPENNSLVRAAIWSRPDEKSPWQHRYAGLFYRIQSGKPSVELSNEVVRMVRTMDRYWRVDIAPSDGLVGRLPTLDLGWVGDRVTFLARGSGPYMLAFGGYDIDSAEQPIEQFLRMLDQDNKPVQPMTAAVGERVVLGGEDRLRLGPRPIPWRTVVLWAVLVGGVLLLAGMAIGLMRQMNKSE